MGIGFENTGYARTPFQSQIPRALKYMDERNALEKQNIEAIQAQTEALKKQTEALNTFREETENLKDAVVSLNERLGWIKR